MTTDLTSRAGRAIAVTLTFTSAALIVVASASINMQYGLSKGADEISSMTWAAVAVASSVGAAFAMPAFLVAVRRRQAAGALLALAAMLLTGAYNLAAALGSAHGGRAHATISETASRGAIERVQREHDAAAAEMATLAPARGAAELRPMMASLRATPGSNNCEVRDGRVSRRVCAEVDALDAEVARAERRERLAQRVRDAGDRLAALRLPRQANADAAALAALATSAGMTATTDDVARLLNVLAVALVEFGGGLLMSAGVVLAGAAPGAVDRRGPGTTMTVDTPVDSATDTCMDTPAPPADTAARSRVGTAVGTVGRDAVAERIVGALRAAGGQLPKSERGLARRVGATKSTLHNAVGMLLTAGVVERVGEALVLRG